MSLKGQRTKSDFLEWERFQLLIHQLGRDNEYRFQLLIAIGCYTGLRISDILKLRWEDLLSGRIEIKEQKTGKLRCIELNHQLKEVIQNTYQNQPETALVFVNRYGTKSISVQYVNKRLKQLFDHYGIKGNYSSHFMRKTLGRRVWNQNNHSEKSLFMLSELFNHSSVRITKIYLGIREKEIQNIYQNL